MKGTIVALDQIDGRRAAALVVDGLLQDLIIDPAPDGPPLPGTIFQAIADRPMKGQGGQFLKLPNGKSAFLRQGKNIPPGQTALVQITGFAEAGKAFPVTTKLLFKGRYAIITPGASGINVSRQIRNSDRRDALIDLIIRNFPEISGMILRYSSEHADDGQIVEEVRSLARQVTDVLEHARQTALRLVHPGIDAHTYVQIEWHSDASAGSETTFRDYGIGEMIDDMTQPLVSLAGDASAWIEPTRALVAVDVNTGGDTSPAAGLKANVALCRDLPRQLRCRGLGGQIVIDFAPFPKKDRRQIEQILRKSFREDPIETALVGWTPLGHFELQRKRARLPVSVGKGG